MSRSWLAPALLYALVAAFQLYPAWTDPAHGVVGDWTHPDMVSNHWLYRWVAETLARGGSILHNDRYYWPVGDAPFLAGNGSDAVPFALVGGWVAWPFSVTLWAMLTVVLNGLGGYAVARAAGAAPAGALVAGAAMVFNPYVSRELSAGRFAQASLWASAGFLASWLRLLDTPTLRRGLVAGVFFGAAAFTYWYDGLWMAMAGGILWLFRPRLRALVGFVPVALATTVPPLVLFLTRWQEIPGTTEVTFPHPLAVTYALSPAFPVWSGSGSLASLCLPVTVTALAFAGWRSSAPWLRRGALAAALLFYLLSLGPELLTPDGTSTGVPGPYVLVYRWTATLQRFWWPYRHLAPLTLALLPLVGRGADRVIAWAAAPGAAVALALLLPLELAARAGADSVETSWFTPPEAYTTLAGLPPGNVLELPLARSFARTQTSLSYQWVHGRTLLNGHAMWVDRVRPAAWDTWIEGQPLLAALRGFEEGKVTGAWSLPAGAAPVDLAAVRYITLNREFFPGELRALLVDHAGFLTAWFGAPVAKAGGVRIWDLARYQGDGSWTFPTWAPPEGYVTSAGLTALPESVRSPGWRNWSRAFPPSAPEAPPAVTAEQHARYASLPPMLRRKLERVTPTKDTGEDE